MFKKKDKTKPVMYRGYRCQIFPDARQQEQIRQTFGCVRKVYNDCLSLQGGLYASGMGRMSTAELNNYYNCFVKKQDAYLLEERGKAFIVIDKWYPSTKTCHECGKKNPKVTLGDRVWRCPHCGAINQRDYNAAVNIRDEGLRVFYTAGTVR